jgi:hypothetical protein
VLSRLGVNLSLVAGNVTGGGGKATRKDYLTALRRKTKHDVQTEWVLAGNGLSVKTFSEYKNRGSLRVHARATLLENELIRSYGVFENASARVRNRSLKRSWSE